MPRSLQTRQEALGVTLALCLIGAVMVFSASAMTAQEKFGTGYIFLLRQFVYIVLGIAGMFALMNTDYRKLRQPRVVFTGLAVTFICWSAFFSGSLARHASLVSPGPLQLSAVGNGQAGGDHFSRLVSGIAPRSRKTWRQRLLGHARPRAGHRSGHGRAGR